MSNLKMPEPFDTWRETDDDAGAWGRPDQPIYTAAQMKQYARDALEQAAQFCDRNAQSTSAEEIRALIKDIQ